MGAKRWDRLHNTIYVISPLAVIHYLLSPDIYPEQYLMSGILFWLLVWRVLNRRGQGTNPMALLLLAVASGLFTAVIEAGWIWAYQDYSFSEIYNVYFTLALGVPTPWKILILGLLIALGCAGRQALRPKAARLQVRKKGAHLVSATAKGGRDPAGGASWGHGRDRHRKCFLLRHLSSRGAKAAAGLRSRSPFYASYFPAQK